MYWVLQSNKCAPCTWKMTAVLIKHVLLPAGLSNFCGFWPPQNSFCPTWMMNQPMRRFPVLVSLLLQYLYLDWVLWAAWTSHMSLSQGDKLPRWDQPFGFLASWTPWNHSSFTLWSVCVCVCVCVCVWVLRPCVHVWECACVGRDSQCLHTCVSVYLIDSLCTRPHIGRVRFAPVTSRRRSVTLHPLGWRLVKWAWSAIFANSATTRKSNTGNDLLRRPSGLISDFLSEQRGSFPSQQVPTRLLYTNYSTGWMCMSRSEFRQVFDLWVNTRRHRILRGNIRVTSEPPEPGGNGYQVGPEPCEKSSLFFLWHVDVFWKSNVNPRHSDGLNRCEKIYESMLVPLQLRSTFPFKLTSSTVCMGWEVLWVNPRDLSGIAPTPWETILQPLPNWYCTIDAVSVFTRKFLSFSSCC